MCIQRAYNRMQEAYYGPENGQFSMSTDEQSEAQDYYSCGLDVASSESIAEAADLTKNLQAIAKTYVNLLEERQAKESILRSNLPSIQRLYAYTNVTANNVSMLAVIAFLCYQNYSLTTSFIYSLLAVQFIRAGARKIGQEMAIYNIRLAELQLLNAGTVKSVQEK